MEEADRELLESATKAMEDLNRELLKLAAKAIGVNVAQGGRIAIDGRIWNPLEDDGDALRLMVKLHIEVSVDAFDARVSSVPAFVPGFGGIYEDAKANPLAATRRAIVRAAAIIGSTRV